MDLPTQDPSNKSRTPDFQLATADDRNFGTGPKPRLRAAARGRDRARKIFRRRASFRKAGTEGLKLRGRGL